MRICLGLAMSCALAFSAAWASDDWGHDFDALIALPATKVILSKTKDHDETREIKLANGVSFYQTRRDGKVIGVFSNDGSGHGAVLCGLAQLLKIRNMLAMCIPRKSAETIAELDSQIDRIADFVGANHLVLPHQDSMSKEAVQSYIEKEKSKVTAAIASGAPETTAISCNAGAGAQIVSHYGEFMGDGKLKKWIDDMLSVPRPPVFNPCM